VPDSIREQLLGAITTAVGGEYGVPAPDDERDLPITIVQDGEEVASPDQYGYTNYEIPLVIAKAVAAPAATEGQSRSEYQDAMRAQCHTMLAGIQTAVFADDTFGGLADGADYTGGSIATEVGKLCFAEAQFTVRYHTVRGDPFTID